MPFPLSSIYADVQTPFDFGVEALDVATVHSIRISNLVLRKKYFYTSQFCVTDQLHTISYLRMA